MSVDKADGSYSMSFMKDNAFLRFLQVRDGIDFESLSKSYDAIELHLSDSEDNLYMMLYGWDCDSILIMNPDVIVCD